MAATSTALPHPLGFVKELAEHVGSSPAAVPSIFLSRNKADPVADIKMEIPSIDFRLLKEGNPDERLRTVRDLGRAFEDWGCFMLVNHGLSERLQTSMVNAFTEFFDQTPEEKHVYDMKQFLDSICYGTSYGFTSKEQRYWRDYLRIFVHPELNCPATPAGFRAIMEEFVQQSREVLNELLRAVWESLELEESFMEDSLQLKSIHQLLVGNIFPPCPQPELVQGFPPHTDPCLLSLAVQNNAFNGLQVMHDGKWVLVDLMPSTVFIFTGDFMEAHLAVKHYRSKVIVNWGDLGMLCGVDRATGGQAATATESMNDVNIDIPVDESVAEEVEARPKRKKKKVAADIIADAITVIARNMEKDNIVPVQPPQQSRADKIYAALAEISDLTEDEIISAIDMLNVDEAKTNVFLALPVSIRRTWLRRHLQE